MSINPVIDFKDAGCNDCGRDDLEHNLSNYPRPDFSERRVGFSSISTSKAGSILDAPTYHDQSRLAL